MVCCSSALLKRSSACWFSFTQVNAFIVLTLNPQDSASSIASWLWLPVYHIARTLSGAAIAHTGRRFRSAMLIVL
ncbi:Uncharacterised protein [Serratia marcescens]|nr:Uncharacterised protein [Serratia marcescens]